MVSEGRLALLKQYCKVDYDEDAMVLSSLAETADAYLAQAGCIRAGHEDMWDMIVCDMVLRQYDGRDDDVEHAATSTLLRQMLNQLKLVCAYGGAADGDTSL